MGKKIFLFALVLFLFSLNGCNCLPSNKCTPPGSDSVKPGAGIRVIYQNDAQEELWRDFNFHETPGEFNIDILAGRTFAVWLTAGDEGCLCLVRYKYIKKRNGTIIENPGWNTSSYSTQPVKNYIKAVNYENPGLTDEYTFNIEARDCRSNITSGQVTVKFKNTLICSNTGNISKFLQWNGELTTPGWTGQLDTGNIGSFCTGRTITTIRLPRLVNPDGPYVGSIVMPQWHAKIDGTDHTGFTCHSTANICEKTVSIPLGTHTIEIWSDSHFPEFQNSMGPGISGYSSEVINLKVE